MTDKDIEVDLGDIPARTRVEFQLPNIGEIIKMSDEDLANYIRTTNAIKYYYCMDCSFTTTSVEDMNDHQKHPNLKHKWRIIKEMFRK